MRPSWSGGLGACLAAAVLVATCTFWSPSAQAQGSLPYADPAVTGAIGLCNKAGQSIDQGSVGDQPFVWSAVSSVGAPAPYNGPGGTATLFAYQPRPDVPAADWSGSQLTGSARYTNPAHPMAQATNVDETLHDFVVAYPARWDGLVELRLYLGEPDQPIDSLKYAATDIKVTGDTWTVVQGGTVACNSGSAVSTEQLLLPQSFLNPSTTVAPGDRSSTGAAAKSGAAGSAGSAGSAGAAGSAGSALAGATMHFTVSRPGSAGSAWRFAALAGIAVVLGMCALAWRRHRSATPTPTSSGGIPRDQ